MNRTYTKLGDIATYTNGYAFKPKDRGSKGLPIIRIQDLTGSVEDKGYYNGKYPANIEINNGNVLISWSASLGIYVWNGGKALLNQHIFKVEFNKKEINRDYFVYAVKYNLSKMKQLTHGATMKHVTKKDFENVTIPYPSLSEQKKMAFVLNMVNKSLSLKLQELNKLDELIKARFVEMFGDPICNSLNKPVDFFINVVKLQRGYDLPVKKRNSNGDIPVFGSNGVLGYHTEFKAKHGIITGRSGTIGNVYREDGKYWPLNTSLFSVDTHGNNIVYLQYLLQMFRLERFYNGAGVPTLNRNDVHKQKIIRTPLELQNEFADFVQQVDKSKFENIVYLNKKLLSKIINKIGR
ncbi:restriction endonuclease subunit S [Lactobacillus sp. LL6]|uniref:restriction endonuclease subunit S n=1 Tax=Lactobacillus sp. LL6 TaxID=2596827 RepID=UPI0011863C35|nr:restriction endonuclease subunit S [Lactobacillus sp. LL6]TSO25421.1 restriction endonuclease subunit S [Lactobacillus sp. LL6]